MSHSEMLKNEMPQTLAEWRQRAAELSFESRAFINDVFVPAASGETFETVNPATGEVLAKVA
ncbi:MAG TPA: aldehyde dehydrogenase PuuC, partial [Halomonas sp.]|nr:aldehyde dehydrogenase PuuC [Halomonas sp.]